MTVLTLLFAVRALAADATTEALDEYLRARESLGQFSGEVLIARRSEPVFHRAYGYADIEDGERFKTNARFPVASLTKGLTALAVILLRDEGDLSLDDSLCRYTDPCPDAWRPVTLRFLLQHASGIPDYEGALLAEGDEAYVRFMASPDNVDEIIAAAAEKPLEFEPGSSFSYSNTGYVLLARVIERVSGRAYSAFIEERILRPAGMRSSDIMRTGRRPKNLPAGYVGLETATSEDLARGMPFETTAYPMAPFSGMAGPHGDAALVATAPDLVAWTRAIAKGGLAKEASLTEMFDPGDSGYGFGWEVRTIADRRRISHTGILPGYVSRLEWFPEEDDLFIVLSNVAFVRMDSILRDIRAIVDGRPYDMPRSRTIVELPEAEVAGLIGEYKLNGASAVVAREGSLLTLSVKDQFTAGLLPEGPSLFYAPFFEGEVRFERGPDGVATSLTLRVQGANYVAPRAG